MTTKPQTLGMISKFEVDFDAVEKGQRLDLWVDTSRPLSDVTPLGNPSNPTAYVARGWMLDRLVFYEGVFGNQVTHRSKRRHAAQVPDSLVIQTFLRGAFDGEIAGEQIRIRTGEVNVTDQSRGHRGLAEPSHVRSLVVAHDLVGYNPSRHPPTMRFGSETVVGRVLLQTLLAIHADLDRISNADAPRIASGFIALLRNILFVDPLLVQQTPDYAVARARLIRDHIDMRIGRERLTADLICARFHISRATLYRDFKEEGGIERDMLGRRLEVALMKLATGVATRGAVAQIAERYGFSSVPHFSREFRRRFGFPLSDVGGGRAHVEALDARDGRLGSKSAGDILERFLRSV